VRYDLAFVTNATKGAGGNGVGGLEGWGLSGASVTAPIDGKGVVAEQVAD